MVSILLGLLVWLLILVLLVYIILLVYSKFKGGKKK